jgi:hypothetical protein
VTSFAKFVHGGCFVAGTKVTVSERPYSLSCESSVWSETEWLSNNDNSYSPSPRFGEKGPGDEGLGSEKFVRSGNASSWAVLDFLTSHASSLKPALQVPIAQHNIIAGKFLPMNIEELHVKGSAFVTSIEDCPEIADGEGSVVTSRFCTREVNTIVRAEILGPDGSIEIVEGTPIHPIWTVDRNDWVPLGELTVGESLQASEGLATVLLLPRVSSSIPVYNVEVHGQHVGRVGTTIQASSWVARPCEFVGGTSLSLRRAWEVLCPAGRSTTNFDSSIAPRHHSSPAHAAIDPGRVGSMGESSWTHKESSGDP